MKKPESRLNRIRIVPSVIPMFTCLSIAIFTGCGGSTPAPAPAQPQTATPDPSKPAAQVVQNTQSQAPAVEEKKDDRKMIDGIPYDVWFDNPLGIAGNNQAVAPVSLPGATVAGSANPAPEKMKAADGGGSAAETTGGVDWKKIIPMPILESQVKDIRNRLTKNMQSVGTYNTSYLELSTFTSTLAALAGIATEHPEDVGWKKNAKYIRDLSASFSEEPLMRGAKSYRKIQIPYEQIIDILNGSAPAGLPDSPEKKPLSDVASMGDLMKRADIAYNWLKSNVGNANALKSEKEKAIQEAHILAAISKIITTEGYGYFDDEGFLNYANPMAEACLKMVEAANSDNYTQFDEGLSRIYKSCTECHSEYKE